MDQILEGISLVLQWENLLLAMFGVAAGMVLGCIPGLNANVGIVLLLPFTFYLGPVPGIAMLMGTVSAVPYRPSCSISRARPTPS